MPTIADLAETDHADTALDTLGVDLPRWLAAIDGSITAADVVNVGTYGAAANAHPACFYAEAADVMADHGDDVLDYLDDHDVEITTRDRSWSGMASECLSAAVELWCQSMMDEDIDIDMDDDDDDDTEGDEVMP